MSRIQLSVGGFAFVPVRVLQSQSTVVCESKCVVYGLFPGYLSLTTRVRDGGDVHECSLHADLGRVAGGDGGDGDLELSSGEHPTADAAVRELVVTLTALRACLGHGFDVLGAGERDHA